MADLRQECDLVMKGGITSGIVYPPLVLKLKDVYRFRNIGGTSAGAIVAAATAAAEYGRDKPDHDSFGVLAQINEELQQGTFLRDLFRPAARTKPLFAVALTLMDHLKGKPARAWRVIAAFTRAAMGNLFYSFGLGALSGALLMAVIIWGVDGRVFGVVGLILLILAAWIGGLIASGLKLWQLLSRQVPANLMGICTGRPEVTAGNLDQEDQTILTDWLYARINAMAGLEHQQPLTFGHLRESPPWRQQEGTQARAPAGPIVLRMMTSNLSQHQPYILPFEDHPFIFCKTEFQQLFPKPVVDHLMREGTQHRDRFVLDPNSDYYFLPEADKLPVIVATRLSLSFPILLSAVPLYTIKASKLANKSAGEVTLVHSDFQINWFSDGGICSNFPLHFFDTWLPSRPTFGVDLRDLPAEGFKSSEQVSADFLSPTARSETHQKHPRQEAVYLPEPDDRLDTEINPLGRDPRWPRLTSFLWAIFQTAQNYRDNLQSMLPSYRERVVRVRLADDEGGLNLAMPENTIQQVMAKGEQAGDILLNQFSFEAHQWVRFRVLLTQMERNLTKMDQQMRTTAFYRNLFAENPQLGEVPYPSSPESLKEATQRLKALGEQVANWETPESITDQPAPLPEPVLRVMPKV